MPKIKTSKSPNTTEKKAIKCPNAKEKSFRVSKYKRLKLHSLQKPKIKAVKSPNANHHLCPYKISHKNIVEKKFNFSVEERHTGKWIQSFILKVL